jgi:hypothetical protein
MLRSLRSSATLTVVTGIVTLTGIGIAFARVPSSSGAEGTQPRSSGRIRTTLATCEGRHAPAVVRPGQCLAISATGFDPKEPVSARLLSSASHVATLVADDAGRLTWRITVAPIVGGHEVATFVGQGRSHGQASAPGNVTATVPRFAIARYRVVPTPPDHDGSKDHNGSKGKGEDR